MAELPTRNKHDSDRHHGAKQSSLDFKVDNRDGDAAAGRGDKEYPDDNDTRERQEPVRNRDGEPMDQDEDLEVENDDDDMGDMAAMMGFGGFGSTKGKKVVGNNVGAVRKEKKTEYRQYMNRVGGFNRPLSPSR